MNSAGAFENQLHNKTHDHPRRQSLHSMLRGGREVGRIHLKLPVETHVTYISALLGLLASTPRQACKYRLGVGCERIVLNTRKKGWNCCRSHSYQMDARGGHR